MAFDPAHLDTSVGALIRSGAGLLGIVLGGFMLAAKPRRRGNVFLGLFLAFDGIGYATYSLVGGFSGFPHKELIVPSHALTSILSVAAAACMVVFGAPYLRALRQDRPRLLVALVTAVAMAAMTPFLLFVADARLPVDLFGNPSGAIAGEADAIAFGLYLAATAAVAIALLASLRRDQDGPQAPARLALAVALLGNLAIWLAVPIVFGAGDLSPIGRVGFIVAGLALLPPLFLLLAVGRIGRWSRWVPATAMLLLLASTVVESLLLLDDRNDSGFGGIASLLFLSLVAFAVFRLDLLGATVPRPRAGALAAIALAALFITAQVAQNFLSDQLGLLLGGVVAGAVVFAAFPLQRAAERAIEARGRTSDKAGGVHDEYRRAAEVAWMDGRLGEKERLLLRQVRDRLGLSSAVAEGIEDEVVAGRRADRGM